jgi:uncharacterized protein (DUF2062 family)
MIKDVGKTIRLLRVIPINSANSNIKPALDDFSGVYDPILLVCPPEETVLSLNGSNKNIWVVRSPRKDRRTMIQTAAAKARQLNMTHILIHDPERAMEPGDIKRWVKITEDSSDAVIIGYRKPPAIDLPVFHRVLRWSAAFMFRLQTGIELHDPGCPVRVYPVSICEHLKLRTHQGAFDTEVLVKAAWAGVPVKELPLEIPYEITDHRKNFTGRMTEIFKKAALNVHWALRSITPIPHKKVADDQEGNGQKISVWHPLRSIRALLTENLTPRKLGWAVALGVSLGALPLIALHTISILFIAGFFRLNKAAALTASQLCMPPIVPALCIEVGYFLRHGSFLTEITVQTLGYQALERIWEWLLGALLVAPVLAALAGGLVYWMGQIYSRREGKGNISPGT